MLRKAFLLLGCVLLLASSVPGFAQDAGAGVPPPVAPPSADTSGATSTQPAGQPDNTKLYRVGKDVKPPRALYNPDPEYSRVAANSGYQGIVLLWLVVGVDGHPDRIRVQRSIGMGLDEAAIAAVKTWRFEPAKLNGQPVPVMISVEVDFRRDGGRPKVSLQPPPEAKGDNPQFPGADLVKFPMVIHIGTITGVPDGKSFEIVASAALKESGETRPLAISCSGKKDSCLFLNAGNYPARWLSQNHRLEITGQQIPGKSWDTAEFTVK